MQPCRSLPWSRACRQCCRVCERAVGERRATESVVGIHKHHRWCGRTAHKIHTRAINTMKNTVSPPHPTPRTLLRKKRCIIAPLFCTISIFKVWHQFVSAGWAKKNRSTWPGEHVQPQNRDSGPSPQCLFNLLSAYCDNISLSCSLQNNEVRLPPPD